jgi:hypothetical protein
MKKIILLFGQGVALGWGTGFCLAGALSLAYRTGRNGPPSAFFYFFMVGGVMGLLGGWCFALQMVLDDFFTALFLKILEMVPPPARKAGKEWTEKMESVLGEVLAPLPGYFRKLMTFLFVSRLRHLGRINRFLEKSDNRDPDSRGRALAVVAFFLEPLRGLFHLAYAILFILSLALWSIPFWGG